YQSFPCSLLRSSTSRTRGGGKRVIDKINALIGVVWLLWSVHRAGAIIEDLAVETEDLELHRGFLLLLEENDPVAGPFGDRLHLQQDQRFVAEALESVGDAARQQYRLALGQVAIDLAVSMKASAPAQHHPNAI